METIIFMQDTHPDDMHSEMKQHMDELMTKITSMESTFRNHFYPTNMDKPINSHSNDVHSEMKQLKDELMAKMISIESTLHNHVE